MCAPGNGIWLWMATRHLKGAHSATGRSAEVYQAVPGTVNLHSGTVNLCARRWSARYLCILGSGIGHGDSLTGMEISKTFGVLAEQCASMNYQSFDFLIMTSGYDLESYDLESVLKGIDE